MQRRNRDNRQDKSFLETFRLILIPVELGFPPNGSSLLEPFDRAVFSIFANRFVVTTNQATLELIEACDLLGF